MEFVQVVNWNWAHTRTEKNSDQTELQGQNESRLWVCEMLFTRTNSARPKRNLDNR